MNNIISVFLGGFLAIAGGSVIKWMEFSFERRSLRAAIKAEIASIVDIIASRSNRDLFHQAVQSWRDGQDFDLFIFTIDEDFTPVYRANVGKVGLLGADVAGDVVRFYDILVGARAELRAHINGQTHRMSHQLRADRLESVLSEVESALELGKSVVGRM